MIWTPLTNRHLYATLKSVTTVNKRRVHMYPIKALGIDLTKFLSEQLSCRNVNFTS